MWGYYIERDSHGIIILRGTQWDYMKRDCYEIIILKGHISDDYIIQIIIFYRVHDWNGPCCPRKAVKLITHPPLQSSWHLKSLASSLFVQQPFYVNNKENIWALHYWSSCEGNLFKTNGCPSQRASNATSVRGASYKIIILKGTRQAWYKMLYLYNVHWPELLVFTSIFAMRWNISINCVHPYILDVKLMILGVNLWSRLHSCAFQIYIPKFYLLFIDLCKSYLNVVFVHFTLIFISIFTSLIKFHNICIQSGAVIAQSNVLQYIQQYYDQGRT